MNIQTRKIEIIAPKDKKEEFMERLQEFGEVEIVSEVPEEKEEFEEFEKKVEELKEVRRFLRSYKEVGNFFIKIIKSFLPRQKKITNKELNQIKTSKKVDDSIKRVKELKNNLSELKPKKEKLIKEVELLEKYSTFNIAKIENKLEGFNFILGEIPISKEDYFRKEIENNLSSFSLKIEEEQEARGKVFVLIYPQSKQNFITKIIKKFNIKTQDLFWEKLPSVKIKENKKEIKEINKKIKKIEDELIQLSEITSKLEVLIDYYSFEIEKEKFLNEAQTSTRYLSLKAWIPENQLDELKEKFSDCLVNTLPIDKEERPPVLIGNGNFRPFEIVTKVYGLPKKDEPDPTLYLAPFFSFQFAFALSDAGYGLILAAISYIAKKMSDDKSVKTFFNLFIVGGILTAIVGLFAGTFFGTDLTKGLRLIDPLANPIDTLIFISYIGAFQIFVGLLIGMFWKIKQKNVKEAIAKEGGSVLLFIGIAAFLFTGKSIFAISAIAGMVILGALFSTANNIGLKLLSGVGSLYDIVGYFSDILSYSRLLALGLATGIIAMVVNMVAFMFKDMVPIPGLDFVIAGIILVVGHTMNLMINSLGAFIHSARLQFVEFFSKFMEGGGKRFNSFSKKGHFIKVSDNK